jgi:nucleotide-binding universal stress UspA family protein
MRRYLIVANRTLAGDHLVRTVRDLNERREASFYIVVPATPPQDHTWTDGEARAIAQARLDAAIKLLSDVGVDAEGEVGDERPTYAIQDVLAKREVDEIIVSTLPHRTSRWLVMDLPHRVRRGFSLPVTHVAGTAGPVA